MKKPESTRTILAVIFFTLGCFAFLYRSLSCFIQVINGSFTGTSSGALLWSFVASAVFMAIAAALHTSAKSMVRNKYALKERGVRVQGKVVDVIYMSTTSYGNKSEHPYYLVCTYTYDNIEHRCKSLLLWQKPLLRSYTIDIYIDPNSGKY